MDSSSRPLMTVRVHESTEWAYHRRFQVADDAVAACKLAKNLRVDSYDKYFRFQLSYYFHRLNNKKKDGRHSLMGDYQPAARLNSGAVIDHLENVAHLVITFCTFYKALM